MSVKNNGIWRKRSLSNLNALTRHSLLPGSLAVSRTATSLGWKILFLTEPIAHNGPGKGQAVGAQHELLKLCGKTFCCKSNNISFNDDRQGWAKYYRPLTNPRAGLGQFQAVFFGISVLLDAITHTSSRTTSLGVDHSSTTRELCPAA